ncbi:MAG: LuxR family transcriptional regulator [Rhodospirillales bacterium]|nr:LuxR family transcriptional regulator [Rhodospirillales bacterium]MCB9973005.1 LuxR family transcriptional regulator [Rhodospirillales bacterium]MCB9980008.1 LuxR family transcriptional regulator [Rhodospirillales bacterium]
MSIGKTPFEEIDGFIAAIDSSENFEQILLALRKQMERLGFNRFTYSLGWPPEGPFKPLYLTTYPPEFTKHYLEKNFRSSDMVYRHASQQSTPFLWEDLKKKYVLTPEQKIVFHDGREVGIHSGASVPIHGPKLARATFSVASDMDEAEFKKLFLHYRHEIHLLSTYAHEKIMKLGIGDKPLVNTTLTARETEILTWTSRGKTRWEIGEILNISEDTVKKHLQKACYALGASNKTHASAVAIINGIIMP